MSVEARALSLRRLIHDSAAIRLLAADNAPVILALIAEYFPRGTRARPAAEVYELMVTDFEVIASEFPMPRTPQNYCNDWVKAGWLVRKSGRSSRGETLEPSEEALSALEAIERWEQPVTTVTASRVESISSALQRLARDTNEDIASRVASLEAERARIDSEIEKAQLGQFERLTAAETEERVQDVLNMAMAVPSDFARVRHDLEALNHQLRRQLLIRRATAVMCWRRSSTAWTTSQNQMRAAASKAFIPSLWIGNAAPGWTSGLNRCSIVKRAKMWHRRENGSCVVSFAIWKKPALRSTRP